MATATLPATEFPAWWLGTPEGKKYQASKDAADRKHREELVKSLNETRTAGEKATAATGSALKKAEDEQAARLPEWKRIARELDQLRHENQSAQNRWQHAIEIAERELRAVCIPEINRLFDDIDGHLRAVNCLGNRWSQQALEPIMKQLRAIRGEVELVPAMSDEDARRKCLELASKASDVAANGRRIHEELNEKAVKATV